MPNLPQSGLKLVAENVGDFLGDLNKAYNSVDRLMDGLGRAAKSGGIFGDMLTGAMHRVGEIAVDALGDAARAAADFVKDGIGAAGDVEENLNVLQVAAKATDAQMAQISKRAVELGSDLTLPATSALDASTAMLELTKSGFSVDQAMGAAKGTLQLAAAAETDAATAAQLMSGALNAFQLEAKDAIHITDLLAGAANASQANITDLSQGFNQAGFAFGAAGLTADDLAVSLAILTKNGLTGSDSGTALKNAMMRLMDPTDKAAKLMHSLGFSAYDAQGQMKPWPMLIADLQTAMAGMDDETRNAALGNIFLSDGMKAMIPLLNLSKEELAGMYTEVTASGQAAELSAARMKGWNGVVEGFNSQMETLGIIIGQKVLPIITPLGQKLNEALGLLGQGDFTGAFTRINEVLQSALGQITAFFQQVGAGTSPISPLLDGMSKALAPLGGMLVNQAKEWLGMLVSFIQKEGPPFLAPISEMLLKEATKWLEALARWIDTQVPVVVAGLQKWANEFTTWIEPMIPPMMEALDKVVIALQKQLQTYQPTIEEELRKWAALFGTILVTEAIPAVFVALGSLVARMLDFLINEEQRIVAGFASWAYHAVQGFQKGLLGIPQKLGELAIDLVYWFADQGNRLAHLGGDLGRAIIDGFGRAIQDGVGWIGDQARNMAQHAINVASSILGSHSPSKVFMELGLDTDRGFAMGLQQGTPMVQGAMASMVAPPALPGAGGSTTIDNSRTIDYHPSYGGQTSGNPQRDSAMARTFAL